MKRFDVIVIGGGQSGLAVGYYLRRTGLNYIILDNQSEAGGSWQHNWQSLRLFSPAQWSSLPGMIMQGGSDYYPTRDETIAYLKQYESKYALNIKRSIDVLNVTVESSEFKLQTTDGDYHAKSLVSATGSFNNAVIPSIAGMNSYRGAIIHSSQYNVPQVFEGKRVAIVGEGNSGAQILAEVSKHAETFWITQKEPRFLPDHIDGRYLFDAATQMYEAQKMGKQFKPPSLGDIVMIDSVKDARAREVLKSYPPIDHFNSDAIVLADNRELNVDAVIFCTGFKPSLKHLSNLNVINNDGKSDTAGTRSKMIEGLWFVGYGNWTGFASATLIGVGRSAKTTVDEITKYVGKEKESQPS